MGGGFSGSPNSLFWLFTMPYKGDTVGGDRELNRGRVYWFLIGDGPLFSRDGSLKQYCFLSNIYIYGKLPELGSGDISLNLIILK